MSSRIFFSLLLLATTSEVVAQAQSEVVPDARRSVILLDDFESYEEGGLPTKWQILDNRELVPVQPRHMNDREKFWVVRERDNQMLRVYSEGEAAHINIVHMDWDLREHPILSWDWRAHRLPDNAREDDKRLNDVGVALYVFFSFDFLGRPKVIKYSYSSTLPVGTVVSYGRLKVIVVSSALDGVGDWRHVERNVAEDYYSVFGKRPPDRPLSIRLWSDSDDTNTIGEADYDNLRFLAR